METAPYKQKKDNHTWRRPSKKRGDCNYQQKGHYVLEKDLWQRNTSGSGGKYLGHKGNRQWRQKRDRYETRVKRKERKEVLLCRKGTPLTFI